MLLKVEVPAGAFRNGTEYEAKGRWWDVSLVRWLAGSLRPIGGWAQFGTATFTGIARGCLAWADSSANRWFAFGTAAGLFVTDDAGAIYDITPAALTAGSADATTSVGYGRGLYGSDPYGTPRPDTGDIVIATSWAMDTWGQYLVACSDADGRLVEWQLITGVDAAAISNAPTANLGLVVTQERFLMALGAGGDPRKVQWCDQGANTTWTPSATNQAGSFILENSGEIRCGIKVPGETLILTSTDLWRAKYIGYPLVYSFQRVDTGCGSPGNRTAIRIGRSAVWLGYGGFYMYDGYARKLRCDVWDLYQERVSPSQASKAFGWLNTDHNEACWLVPSDTSNECDFYITWNYVEDWWSFCEVGAFERSCGAGPGVFQTPILCGTDGKLYRHETGADHGSETPYGEAVLPDMGNGERVMHVRTVYPDEQTLADTTLTFYVKPYPTASESTFGPYTMTNPTSVRFNGRHIRMRVSGSQETDWRLGKPRLDVVPGGRR